MAESEKEANDEVSPDDKVKQDDELNDLLSSALQDFDNFDKKEANPLKSSSTPNPVETVEDAGPTTEMFDSKWTEEFIKEAAAAFNFDGNTDVTADQIGANFQKIAEAAAQAISEDTSEGDFSEAISRTLKNLSEGADNLQNQFSDEHLANLFGGLGLGEGGTENGDFIRFMQTMMQSLLSKEILYPPLKDIIDKYPAWLDENKDKLEQSEYDRYCKQNSLMIEICGELEKEKDTDSSQVKEQRCNIILDLMQKMQNCGQPPKDLVGDMNSMITFDSQGNPVLPGMPAGTDPSQCVVM